LENNGLINGFDAFLNEEEDRSRLIAFLKSNNFKISVLIHN